MIRDRLRALLPRRHPAVWWAWYVLLVLVAAVVAAAFGVTTASARGALGPHETRFEVTTDGAYTVDLGPLGTLQLDSGLPGPLGVRAVVQEIPQDAAGVGQVDTLTALQEDLDQYVGLFHGVSSELHSVRDALVRDAVRRALAMFVALVVVGACLRVLLGRKRRDEIAAPARAHPRVAVAAGLVVVVGAGTVTGSWVVRDRPRTEGVAASRVFDGTALEGARITGRLGGIVDTYSGMVVSSIQANDDFYDEAAGSLRTAWGDYETRRDETPDATATTAPPDGSVSDTPAPDGAAPDSAAEPTTPAPESGTPEGAVPEGAVPEGGPQSPSPTAPPSPSPTPTKPPVTMVFVSDLHCNVGMAKVIAELATLSGAQIVVDGGDTVISGTAVEEQCVQTFASAIPRGVRLVAVAGNHDSDVTTRAYASAGATVLSGSVVTVDGVRFFGDADPYRTTFGGGTSSTGENEQQAGQRVADASCGKRVDVLLIHNPRVATPSLERGCTPASLSGHLHVRNDPVQAGQGVRYVSGTSGGAKEGAVTLGPLQATAELTVLRWDPTTRLFVSWQLVEIDASGTATVHDPQPWPQVVDHLDTPAPEPTGGY